MNPTNLMEFKKEVVEDREVPESLCIEEKKVA
jgi:hypothetical protein